MPTSKFSRLKCFRPLFLYVIQALQYKEASTTIDELIEAMVKSFERFSSVESTKIFLSLQACMIEIMKTKGSNNYKIPHIQKGVMQRQGTLPTQLKCEISLVEEVMHHI